MGVSAVSSPSKVSGGDKAAKLYGSWLATLVRSQRKKQTDMGGTHQTAVEARIPSMTAVEM